MFISANALPAAAAAMVNSHLSAVVWAIFASEAFLYFRTVSPPNVT